MHIKADEFYERFGHRPASNFTRASWSIMPMRQTTKQAKNQLNNAMKS